MYLFIIAFIITLFLAYRAGQEGDVVVNQDKSFSWGAFVIVTIMGMVVYVFVALILLVCVSTSEKYHTCEYRDQSIQSFRMDKQSEITGSFVLGCGVVNGGEELTYVSYAQFPEGLLLIKCDRENTYLREVDSIPTIKRYWVRKIFTGYRSKWIGNTYPNVHEWQVNYGRKTIVVPPNTVRLEFNTVE